MTKAEQSGPESPDISPEIRMAEEIARDYARFNELTDEEIETLDGQIEWLKLLTENVEGTAAEVELTEEHVVCSYRPFDHLTNAAFLGNDRLIVAGSSASYVTPFGLGIDPERKGKINAQYSLLQPDYAEVLISRGGNYMAFDSADTGIVLAQSDTGGGEVGILANHYSDTEEQLLALSPEGALLLQSDSALKLMYMKTIELENLLEKDMPSMLDLEWSAFSPEGGAFAYQQRNEAVMLRTGSLGNVKLLQSPKTETVFNFRSTRDIDMVCPLSNRSALLHLRNGNFLFMPMPDIQPKKNPSRAELDNAFLGGAGSMRMENGELVVVPDIIKHIEIDASNLPVKSVECFALEHQLGRLALAEGREVYVISSAALSIGKLLVREHYSAESAVTALDFTDDCKHLLVGQADGTVKVFDLRGNK